MYDGVNGINDIIYNTCVGTHKYWPDRKDRNLTFGGANIRKLIEEQGCIY